MVQNDKRSLNRLSQADEFVHFGVGHLKILNFSFFGQDHSGYDNDICLIRVVPEFMFDEKYVRPLNISTEANAAACSDGTKCLISGWGRTEVNFQFDPGCSS